MADKCGTKYGAGRMPPLLILNASDESLSMLASI